MPSRPSSRPPAQPRPSRPYQSKQKTGLSAREANYEEKRTQARQLYLMGMSYREIAERIGLSESGYVTIARWVDKYGWKAEREEQEQASKNAKKQTYLQRVSTIQEAHLRLAERVRRVAELALEGFIETDETTGEITGVKTNPRTGLPAISPYAIQQLIVAAADLERKALGVELLPTEEMAQLPGPTVDVTPLGAEHQEMLRRMGDYLAQQALLIPAVEAAPEAVSEATLQPDDADTPPETSASTPE